MELSVGSLFSRIGGIALAFEQAGLDIVWTNEIDAASRIYRHNFSDFNLVECNIRKVAVFDILDLDVLTAGFSFQPFSIAGMQKGFNDELGNLKYYKEGVSTLWIDIRRNKGAKICRQ